MDISLRSGGGIFTILGIVGLGCLILAFKIFGYVLAISEALFAVLVLLFYLKLLFNAIKRKDTRFIVISLIILVAGAIVGYIYPLEIADVALRFPYSSLFYSALFLAIAGMFYVIDIPLYTGEKGADLMMLIICFLALFGIVYLFCFIVQLSTGNDDIYSSTKWLVQNNYLDERKSGQTKTEREILEEFIANTNDNIELFKDGKVSKEVAEEQNYIVGIRDNQKTGNIIDVHIWFYSVLVKSKCNYFIIKILKLRVSSYIFI